MSFEVEKSVENLQSLTASVSGQLDELYAKLGTVVTAVATLNGELDELPTPKYLHELISDLGSLHHVLSKAVEPVAEFPNGRLLRDTTEAASELAAELREVKAVWESLPSDEEIERRIEVLGRVAR